MASLQQRGKTFTVIWREGGRQQRKTFKTRPEAQTFKAETEAAVYRGRRSTGDQTTTVGQWWETWQSQRVNVRDSTLLRGQQIFNAHIQPRWGSIRLGEVQHQDVQAWVAGMTLAPATTKRIIAEFRSMLKAAQRAKLITDNPAEDLTLPKLVKKTMTIATPEALTALSNEVPDRCKALVLLLGYAGLRIGEALALEPRDISSQYVHVNKTMTRDASNRATVGTPKSAAGDRFVPIPSWLYEALKEHMTTYPSVHVFTGREGGRMHMQNFSQRTFKDAVERLAVDRVIKGEQIPARFPSIAGMTPHDLRHTCITYWIQAGIPLPQVVKWAGHSDAAFTLNRYAHYFPKDDTKYMDMLSAYTNN